MNADVGEGMDTDKALMPYLKYANIACGGHAGNAKTIKQTILLAKQHRVLVGAHPSYPDKENFGRKSLSMSLVDLEISLLEQVHCFQKIANTLGNHMHHIKLHGALYNDIFKKQQTSQWFLDFINTNFKKCQVFVPSMAKKFVPLNQRNVFYEAFADRNYMDDLSLVPRIKNNAILNTPDKVCAHVKQMYTTNTVTSVTGKKVAIKADTFCLHGDHSNVLAIAESISNLMYCS
ncbi:LamB/YcsF family protein [Aquimarina agarivorans]|uniref:LamB/YcsF family protein n=1 Tax=Aquimarina agarivorans TaxID=980584 RepID=UPI000248E7BA|nr:LamB/YcsF family protein [Aquimarina agarivorans]